MHTTSLLIHLSLAAAARDVSLFTLLDDDERDPLDLTLDLGGSQAVRRRMQRRPTPQRSDECDAVEANDMEASMSATNADHGAHPQEDNEG